MSRRVYGVAALIGVLFFFITVGGSACTGDCEAGCRFDVSTMSLLFHFQHFSLWVKVAEKPDVNREDQRREGHWPGRVYRHEDFSESEASDVSTTATYYIKPPPITLSMQSREVGEPPGNSATLFRTPSGHRNLTNNQEIRASKASV